MVATEGKASPEIVSRILNLALTKIK